MTPHAEDLKEAVPPLTEGEWALARYLNNHLPASWEVFVRPKLNGHEPDIIALDPRRGFTIYEVKDFSASAYSRRGNHLYVNVGSGVRIHDPYDQANRYRETILRTLCPYLGEIVDRDPKAFVSFGVRVYAHGMDTETARRLFTSSTARPCDIFGSDGLLKSPTWETAPGAFLFASKHLQDQIGERAMEYLLTWLRTPMHVKSKAEPLPLNRHQRRYAESRPGWYKLRGPVGSGKTDILAQRAANIASQGKRVLVCCFNITLVHYIRDRVARAARKGCCGEVVFRHFHGLCSDELFRLGESWDPNEETHADAIVSQVRVAAATAESERSEKPKYDAILIDEAQDFNRSWVELLAEYLEADGELVIVSDKSQNLYGRDLAWTERPIRGLPFERWIDLPSTSHRLPSQLVEWLSAFARDNGVFAKDVLPLAPDSNRSFEFAGLSWLRCSADRIPESARLAAEYLCDSGAVSHPSDICILVFTHQTGWAVVNEFENRGQSINHVLREPGAKRDTRRKRSFWMGDGRLKVCTVHSFKGWEIPAVILVVEASPLRDHLIFQGLSRAQTHVCVIDATEGILSWGHPWREIAFGQQENPV